MPELDSHGSRIVLPVLLKDDPEGSIHYKSTRNQKSFIGDPMPEKSHENLAGKILNPKDLVAYQDGSVVSRMIVYKKSGTLTLFAFDAGEGLSEHTAPFDAIASIIDGEAEITIEKIPFLLKEGQMIIMPANKPHALHAHQRFKMLLTMIHA